MEDSHFWYRNIKNSINSQMLSILSWARRLPLDPVGTVWKYSTCLDATELNFKKSKQSLQEMNRGLQNARMKRSSIQPLLGTMP